MRIRLTLAADTWTDVSDTVALVGDELSVITPLSDVKLALSIAEPSDGEAMTADEAYGVSLNSDVNDTLALWVYSTAGGNVHFYNHGNLRTLKAVVDDTAEDGAEVNLSQPTKTVVAITGATTSVAIPAGVTGVEFVSTVLTPTTTTASITVEAWGAADTVRDVFSGLKTSFIAAATLAVLSAATYFVNTTGADDNQKWISGSLFDPRDATIRSVTRGKAVVNSTAVEVHMAELVQDVAGDIDTLRFVVSAGTVTGNVFIRWNYS